MNRREFIKTTSAVVSTATLFGGHEKLFAAGMDNVKVALVGCGGRGTGALGNFHEAARHLNMKVEIVALADFFMSQATKVAEKFKVPKELCLAGPTAYKKVMATDADIVLLVTPPNFRPVHFEAAINAGKHVFMEKPVAVDPPGARKIIDVGELANQKGLAVVAGTQRRHENSYLETHFAINKGAIGPIRNAKVWWCGGALWYRERHPGEDDASYLVRNWVNFTEMSGDHIVEQHVHNLDVANWFLDRYPKTALGFGDRVHRKTGNQYDFFSIDYDYGDGVNVHSMCRQINGTYPRISEFFTGTTGSTFGSGQGKEEFATPYKMPPKPHVKNPYVQEHINLLDSIARGNPLNEAKNVGTSTMTGIMGRISAYTGQMIRWSDLMENTESPFYNLAMSPSPMDFEKGTVKAPEEETAAKPGKPS
ncbi:MAG: Gfo/Idh/MocA family oxidoreductase [Phycisphaerae bacterium]|nr:Gfo/Idh/MocA family oxidoreductase [Phycisphaerae bacterium]